MPCYTPGLACLPRSPPPHPPRRSRPCRVSNSAPCWHATPPRRPCCSPFACNWALTACGNNSACNWTLTPSGNKCGGFLWNRCGYVFFFFFFFSLSLLFVFFFFLGAQLPVLSALCLLFFVFWYVFLYFCSHVYFPFFF